MTTNTSHYNVFRAGSKTYFYSSMFFPPAIRDEVAVLYSFVRVADNFVDSTPQDSSGFYQFRQWFTLAWAGQEVPSQVVKDFVALAQRRNFAISWIEAFLDAMAQDLTVKTYHTLTDTLAYMYGSAEVIGSMMAQIFGLPESSLPSARMLGRSMQYINFIRDIQEDLNLGRVYLPRDELIEAGLTELTESAAEANPRAFSIFMRQQISHYLYWHEAAKEGFSYLPKSIRIPVATATAMYHWTAMQIAKEPLIVFKKKVKPSRPRIVGCGLMHGVAAFGARG